MAAIVAVHQRQSRYTLSVAIKGDVGLRRIGVDLYNDAAAIALAQQITQAGLRFAGLLSLMPGMRMVLATPLRLHR